MSRDQVERTHRLGPKVDRSGKARQRNFIIRFIRENARDRVYKARFNLKTVTVELTIKNHTNVVVSCIYRTPGSPIVTFCENLELNLSDVKSIKTIFVCGDFNIGLLKHEKHNNTKVSRHNV